MLLNGRGRGRGGVLSPMTAGSVGIGRVFIFFCKFRRDWEAWGRGSGSVTLQNLMLLSLSLRASPK